MQSFAQDLAEISRGLSRRRLLALAAATGIAPAVLGRAARAAVPEVVLCNWGGDAIAAFGESFVKHYDGTTGGKLVLDGSGPSNGKVRAMVEARNVSWDLIDSGVTGLAELAPRGLLTPIDYGVVDKSKVLPGFAYEYGVCNYMFSSVQAWNTQKVPAGTVPTLADFFDLKKIPGKRMIRKDSQAMLEMALLADGVPRESLYPLDVDRGLRKLAGIKDSLLTWDTGAQSQALLRDGEVSMGWLWNTRANLLKREPGSRVDWTFEGGLLQPGLWAVPKGNPAGKQAMMAIAAMQDPPGQVSLLAALGNGPANPAASALVPPALQDVDPSSPANAAKQAAISADWYAAHHGATFRRFLDFLSA
jgi:putative spermidine/putrescine transport system substrate-binding protein